MTQKADKWRPDPRNATYADLIQRQLNLRSKGAAVDYTLGVARQFGEAKDDKEIVALAKKLILRPVGGKRIDVEALTAQEIESQIEDLKAKLAVMEDD